MRVRTLALALSLACTAGLQAEVQGIDFVGFGEQGPSTAYASGRWIVARFQVRDTEDLGEPVNVVLRRDDGATTVIANVQERNTVHTVAVPLKEAAWTLNEYEAFVFEPRSGAIHDGTTSRSVIQVGGGAAPTELASTLERTRARLTAEGAAPPPPSVFEPAPGFDAELAVGGDYDGFAGAL